MLEFFRHLFTSDFMPHGHCYLWRPGILWLHVISDGLITAAYCSIPISLLYFVSRRRDIAFEWMFVMFGAFICACGMTHLLEIVTVWRPIYRFAGLIKAVTATASVSTAILLWQLMPRMLKLPSPTQLKESNQRLETEGAARTAVEAELRASRDELEQRVRERTAELARANTELRSEIVARQRAEQETRTSQQQLQSILDYAPAMIALKDRAGRYLLANRAFSTVCNIPAAEVVGKTSAEIFPAETVAPDDGLNEQIFATGKPQEADAMIPGADGPRHFRSLHFLLPGLNGAPDSIGVISHDITERKRAEQALLEAREEADRANRAKSDFLSRMSHELRTPLNAILGFAQLLEIDSPTPRQSDAIGHILKGGRHLLELVNEVLDIARAEAGHMSLSPEPVNAATVFEESLDLIRPLAQQRGLKLECRFCAQERRDESWVLADRQRLKQILVNLLSNAVKFNREGGTITVSCAAVSDERLRIGVRDTGPGISPADQKRIFSAFERLAADRTGVEGTGLGLALAKRLTDMMGGNISVESTLGEGSIFCLELPRAAAQPLSPELPASDPTKETRAAARTVLYIEDNSSNLELVQHILDNRPGLRLVSATRGDVGLEMVREHRPDIILLDLDLPGLHGRDVLRNLRLDPPTRETPVVVISANALPRTIEQTLAAGASAYLTKPINVRDFLGTLDEQLETAPGAASATP